MVGLTLLVHGIWRRGWKWDVFLKDTIISMMIILLIIEPPEVSLWEGVPAGLVVVGSFIVRAFVRYK